MDHTISVNLRFRPRKVAFLVNPPNCDRELLNSIYHYNVFKWGGRYNPIIPCDGETISHEWWQILKLVDPDVIKSFVPLKPDLIVRINKVIAPYEIEFLDEHRPNQRLHSGAGVLDPQENLDVLPLLRNVVPQKEWPHKPVFLFIKDNDGGSAYYDFLLRNFGMYDDVFSIQQTVAKIQHEDLDPSEVGPLDFLKKAQSRASFYMYPMTVAQIESTRPRVKYSPDGRGLYISVGDSPLDAIYAWNAIFLSGQEWNYGVNRLWLPQAFLDDESILDAICEWLNSAYWAPQDHNGTITIVSSSVEQNALNILAEKIKKVMHRHAGFAAPGFPVVEPEISYPEPFHLTEQRPLSHGKALFTCPQPAFLSPGEQGGCWMVDLKISFHPERYTYTNKEYWWILPKRPILSTLFFEGRNSRIIEGGLPSCIASPSNQVLPVRIPDERSVFYYLLTREQIPNYGPGSQRHATQNKYRDIGISDKGLCMRGILDLFGSLFRCGHTLAEPYWRGVFEKMAREIESDREQRKDQVKQKLAKHLPAQPEVLVDREAFLDRMSLYVLNLAKGLPKTDREVSFDYFFNKASIKRTTDPTIRNQSGIRIGDPESELRDDLAWLVERGIILQGVKPKCQVCGSRFWYAVDDIKSKLTCPGCRNIYDLPIEPTWLYKLNTLTRNVIAYHGLIPAILILHCLEWSWQSQDSFYFIESQNLYADHTSSSPLAELDLVLVAGGKFAIGEVKTDPSEFSETELDHLYDVATEVRPDAVIMGAMTAKFPDRLLNQLTRLQERLKLLDIEFWPIQLPEYYFDTKQNPYNRTPTEPSDTSTVGQ